MPPLEGEEGTIMGLPAPTAATAVEDDAWKGRGEKSGSDDDARESPRPPC